MNLLFAFLLLWSFSNPETFNSDTGTLHIEIANIKNMKGQLGILVFQKNEGYPDDFEKAFRSTLQPIQDSRMIIKLEDLPFGDYVFTILHDENMNGKMDKRMFGKPKEGYGVSNNPKPRKFGPPKFEESLVKFAAEQMKIEINLRYDD